MTQKPPTKTPTEPGLGNGTPRPGSAEVKRVRDSIRREDPNDAPPPPPPPSQRSASWQPNEDPTSTRKKGTATAAGARPSASPVGGAARSVRPTLTVDKVGDTAVNLARSPHGAPRLIASKMALEKAPIDTRAAFVLSMIDGHNTVDAVVDMSGMPEEEVRNILARLARLGLITVP